MRRFPLLEPLVFFALPPSLAAIVPTILRENRNIVRDRVERRNKLAHPDYFSLMVNDEQQPSEDFLLAQANHLIIAGFDPNTNLFTSGVHYLLTNPTKLDKLQQEARNRFDNYHDIDGDSLEDLPWLNAVIQESLRLHTNGAFGLPRFSPGAFVDGHWVPKGSVKH
jgi:cytochrome P450